jgi:FtsZ-binding cell division protein ZapB
MKFRRKRSNKWKSKAKARIKEINALLKRIKELIKSRDNWHNKYTDLQKKYKELEEENKKLKRELGKPEINHQAPNKAQKPKYHSFSIVVIQVLLTITLKGNIKFRTLSKVEKIRYDVIKGNNEAPSHVTIRNWVLKVGYYELTRTKEKSDDRIVILDHSIGLGQEKIFVVYSIYEKDFLKLNRPLQYSDLEVLLVKSVKKSDGELVASDILELIEKYGINYAVGDYGSDIKKGLRLLDIPHIHDLSHLFSIHIEKLYDKDERYQNLKKEMSLMRKKFSQTTIAAIIPPKKRKKSEYQSFDKLIIWSERALDLLNNRLTDKKIIKELIKEFDNATLERIRQELDWINNYTELIKELSEINTVLKEIEKDMKHNGLTTITLINAEVSLEKLTTANGILFKNNLLPKLHEQFNLLPDKDVILCSSDILESTFGKYKNRLSENSMASVTDLMLIIAAYTCNLTEEKIIECMENVKISDIKKWSEENVGTSLSKQRSLLLSG